MRERNGRPHDRALSVVPSAGGGRKKEATRGTWHSETERSPDQPAETHLDPATASTGIGRTFHATCPGLKLTSPNRVRGITRGAALSEAARRKRQREVGVWTTRQHVPILPLTAPVCGKSKVDVTIVRIAPRAFDDDNFIASCKALRDGIAESFGLTDNDPRITFWYEQAHGKPKEYAVRIEYRFRKP